MKKTADKAFDIYQPFIVSAINVVKEVAGIRLTKKALYTQYGKISSGGTSVSIDVIGDIQGQVVYEFSRDFTMRLSSRMLRDAEIIATNLSEYIKLLESVLKEVSNMISGHVLSSIHGKYKNLNIGTPQIFLGRGSKLFDKKKKVVVVELSSPFGDFTINLNLRKNLE